MTTPQKTLRERAKTQFLVFTERNNRNLWGYELEKILEQVSEETKAKCLEALPEHFEEKKPQLGESNFGKKMRRANNNYINGYNSSTKTAREAIKNLSV